jgi:starch synthase
MSEILHVTPVMPVDEHHIEYALDSSLCAGSLATSWVPGPVSSAMMKMVPFLRRHMRRDPVRLRSRHLVKHFWPDIRRTVDLRAGLLGTDLLAHDAFFERIDQAASRLVTQQTSLVIGREFGCARTFSRAREFGAGRVYHLPTTHHARLQRILNFEQEQFPGVCGATFVESEFQPDRLQRCQREIELADRIICPSSFVRESLVEAGVDESRISLVPFGCETSWIDQKRGPAGNTFVFVGNISARKGAHRLLRAWKSLKAHHSHRLLLIGDMHLSPAFLKDFVGVYEHVPRLPREDLRDVYLNAQALVLPALAEGFALVILEALSCGTPVLASRNSGAAGFLTDGEDAMLYEAQNDEALCQTLDYALRHPAELRQIGDQGRSKARAWTWKSFEHKFMEAIRAMVHTAGQETLAVK